MAWILTLQSVPEAVGNFSVVMYQADTTDIFFIPAYFTLNLTLFVFHVQVLAMAAEPAATKEFNCEEEGFFPDPDDCHSYYRCTNTLSAKHESCFRWTYFHPIIKGCSIGGCSIWTNPSRFGLPEANTTTNVSEQFQCPTVGQFPDPKDCRSYYSCNSKLKPQRYLCFFGIGHYDIENNICTLGLCWYIPNVSFDHMHKIDPHIYTPHQAYFWWVKKP